MTAGKQQIRTKHSWKLCLGEGRGCGVIEEKLPPNWRTQSGPRVPDVYAHPAVANVGV